MDVYSICPGDTGQQFNNNPTQQFQGNRDIPITRQPQFSGSLLSRPDPDQVTDGSSHLHAIQYLKSVEKIFIQQNIALLEVVLEIESRNKYQILDPLGQKIFLALEESGFCIRLLCGPIRNFQMHIFDNLNNEVIRMYRHLACQCCPFCLQKIEIFCPTDVLVGYVEQEFTLLHPRFGVHDRDGTKVLQIEGPICQCKCCKDVEYQITDLAGQSVGTISKQWMGFLQEGFTDADSFRLEFQRDLDVNMKMALLGATFLIDYMFYEKNKNF